MPPIAVCIDAILLDTLRIMARTQQMILSRRISCLLLVVAACLLWSSSAVAAGYAAHGLECGGGPRERGSGQTDAAGNFYLACEFQNGAVRPHIRIYSPAGVLRQVVDVAFPADGYRNYVGDVAPSPDGRYLYVVRHETHRHHRLVRQADGSYVLDHAWKLAAYQLWGGAYEPRGEFIATDHHGFIYVSTGTWSPGPTNVVKYNPDGTVNTRFGDWERSRTPGTFYWMLGGLSVTADGSSVYTTEVGNNRIQRFDRQLDGSYRFALQWGNTAADDGADNPATAADESRIGLCYQPGKFAAPYDVALDAHGSVFVINTTCIANGMIEVQKFTRDGQWLASYTAYAPTWERVHAIAIDAAGNIYLAQAKVVLRPDNAAPGDATAPQIRTVTAPATTQEQAIMLDIDAIDNVGVTHMRLANEDQQLAGAPWVPYTARVLHTLSAGEGAKTVRVQVRDAAGNLSAVAVATTTVVRAPVDATAPTITRLAAPVATQQRQVAITLEAADDTGVAHMRLANEDQDINTAAWQAFASPAQHQLSANAGDKVVSVQVRDAAGNVSAVATATMTYAPPVMNAAPTLRAVVIPNPTPNREITVTIDATDDAGVTEMRLATEDGNWQAWQPFNAQARFMLSAGAGIKGVFVQVRDAQRAESVIMYRTTHYTATEPAPAPANTAPTLRDVQIPNPTAMQAITVAIDAVDDAGVTDMRLATEAGVWGAWQPFERQALFTLSAGAGMKGVFVQVRDAQRAESVILYRTTRYTGAGPAPAPDPLPPAQPAVDTRPTITAVLLPNPTTTQQVTVRISAADDHGVTEMRLANEDGNWKPWQPYQETTTWLLTPRAMVKGVFVQVRDIRGQHSTTVFKTTLCTPCTAPAVARAGAQTRATTTAARSARRMVIRGTMRADRPRPRSGNHHYDFSQADARRDVIKCGRGFDTVLKRPGDRTIGCERVVTVRTPR